MDRASIEEIAEKESDNVMSFFHRVFKEGFIAGFIEGLKFGGK